MSKFDTATPRHPKDFYPVDFFASGHCSTLWSRDADNRALWVVLILIPVPFMKYECSNVLARAVVDDFGSLHIVEKFR